MYKNSLNTIVFKLQVIFLIMKVLKNQTVAVTHLAIRIDSNFTHHVVAIEKVAE